MGEGMSTGGAFLAGLVAGIGIGIVVTVMYLAVSTALGVEEILREERELPVLTVKEGSGGRTDG